MTERWITDEDEPLLIVDSKGEYESISVLYREDAPTVRDLLNDYDEKYIDEFSLRETLQLEVQRLEKENEQLKQQLRTRHIVQKQYEENKQLSEENEQLKQSVNNLKETILKITIAYQRKHDNTIVNLVDEVHEEDITDLIKELRE